MARKLSETDEKGDDENTSRRTKEIYFPEMLSLQRKEPYKFERPRQRTEAFTLAWVSYMLYEFHLWKFIYY